MRRAWTLGGVLTVVVLGLMLARGRAPESSSPERPAARASGAHAALGGVAVPPDVSSREAVAPIRGTVRDARGPVAGARVLLSVTEAEESLSSLPCPMNARSSLLDCGRSDLLSERVAQRAGDAPVLARTTSGADGSFSLDAPRTGLAYLWVESPEGVAVRRDVRAGDTVELVLEPGVRVSGVVRDDAQAPVAGALVTAVFQTHSRFFEALTDATGNYALGPVPRGPYVVLATHEGLLPQHEERLGFLSTLRVEFALARPRRLSGEVVRGGTPVAGARVTLVDLWVKAEQHVLTDARGHFSFGGLRLYSPYTLRAAHAGDQALLPVLMEDEPSAPRVERTGLTLALEPAVSLHGTVRDDAGRPLVDAQVTVDWRGTGDPFVPQVALVRTDAQGRYAVEALAPGVFKIQAEAKEMMSPGSRELDVREGTGQADFVFPPTTRVEGVLVDEADRPVAQEWLSLVSPPDEPEPFQTSSGEDGRFVFALPRPGRYQLRWRDLSHQARLLGEITAPTTGLRVRIERPRTVRGVVMDARGLPLPGVDVSLWPEAVRSDTRYLDRTLTDAEGHFALDVPAPGRYQLSAEFILDDVAQATSRELEVGAGEAQVALRLEAGHALSGTVMEAKGHPLEGVEVEVVSALHVPVSHCSTPVGTVTDAEGRFRLQRVSGESLVLKLVRRRERLPTQYKKIALSPGATEVRVVLEDKAE